MFLLHKSMLLFDQNYTSEIIHVVMTQMQNMTGSKITPVKK